MRGAWAEESLLSQSGDSELRHHDPWEVPAGDPLETSSPPAGATAQPRVQSQTQVWLEECASGSHGGGVSAHGAGFWRAEVPGVWHGGPAASLPGLRLGSSPSHCEALDTGASVSPTVADSWGRWKGHRDQGPKALRRHHAQQAGPCHLGCHRDAGDTFSPKGQGAGSSRNSACLQLRSGHGVNGASPR